MVTIKKNAGLGYYIEPTVGNAPTLSPTKQLRFTRLVSEDLNSNYSRDESNEVRGDAQTAGSVVTGVSGSGTVSIQYSLETYDELIAGLLFSAGTIDDTDPLEGWKGVTGIDTWSGETVTNGSGTWALATNVLTLDATNVATLSISVAGGADYVQIDGSGNANLDGVWRVDDIASEAVTLESPNASQDVATYTGLGAVTLSSQTSMTITPIFGVAANGVFDRSFGFTRFYSTTDLAGSPSADDLDAVDVAVFRGAFVTTMQLSVAPGQAGWTGSLSVLHAGEESSTDITDFAQTPLSGFALTDWEDSVAPNSNPLPDAILGVANVKLRKIGVADGTRIDPLSLNLSISNNASEVAALRNAGALAVIQGSTSASVDMEVIYEDDLLHQSMIDDDAYEIEIGVSDSDGKAQLIRLPKCRLTSERPNPGKNAPIVQRLTFTAEPGGADWTGASGAKMVEIIRFYDAT